MAADDPAHPATPATGDPVHNARADETIAEYPGRNVTLEAVLDDIIDCQPANTFFVQSNATATGFTDHAMNFVCVNVAPGNGVPQQQWPGRLFA
jgi:hypothetical protein